MTKKENDVFSLDPPDTNSDVPVIPFYEDDEIDYSKMQLLPDFEKLEQDIKLIKEALRMLIGGMNYDPEAEALYRKLKEGDRDDTEKL